MSGVVFSPRRKVLRMGSARVWHPFVSVAPLLWVGSISALGGSVRLYHYERGSSCIAFKKLDKKTRSNYKLGGLAVVLGFCFVVSSLHLHGFLLRVVLYRGYFQSVLCLYYHCERWVVRWRVGVG